MSDLDIKDLKNRVELSNVTLAEIVGGRKGRNPQTGDPIKIKAHNVVIYSWGFSSINYFETEAQ